MLFEKIRDEVTDIGREIAASGFNLGTWGNISARADEDHIAITPSGVAYQTMKAEDIVVVSLDGQTIDGDKKPSIELPLHTAVYQVKKEIIIEVQQ